ncbi:MAG: cytidine deaminase [Bacteroidales bacterium]
MREVTISSIVFEYDTLEELTFDDQELVRFSHKSAADAYAPYSGFRVGASVRLDNGEIITGNNQENAAYPSGICAERVALFYANARYPGLSVIAIAISALKHDGSYTEYPVFPCGSCRQVILETASRYDVEPRLILAGKNKIQVVKSIKDILPLFFDKGSLNDIPR